MSIAHTVTTPAATLHMLRLLPDLQALAQWAAATGQRALREDIGYALHAALRATLGDLAPRPFALLRRPGSVQLIGYSMQPAAALAQGVDMAATTDPLAAMAVGLQQRQQPVIKAMPVHWQAGQTLSFEARVAPLVRSRTAEPGRCIEMDAAYHPSCCGEVPGDRDAAYARWLDREIGRDGAATRLSHRPQAFTLTPIARRSCRDAGGTASRGLRHGLLPDLTVRGQLRVDDPGAFNALLARGLGRHRGFGFGCLLLAPPGAWT